jgi:4-amino-4-deoxy-L-arabinose transferase-like glycosyltransferase
MLVAVFLMSLVGALPSLTRYHSDEKYYTHAALDMMESGDYWTPRALDGDTRFRKPALAYWVLTASFHAIGINVFSSRLPMLISACLLLMLTHRLSRALFGAGAWNWLAVALMASNVQVITLATRATPDVLQCLFLTAALCGFAEIILRRETDALTVPLAYLGVGLATATKGLLGGITLMYTLGIAVRLRGRTTPWRQLVPPLWLAVALALGLGWFVVMYVRHGISALVAFVADQTGQEHQNANATFIANLMQYMLAPARHFLPWSILVAVLAATGWERFRTFIRQHKEATIYVAGWCVLLLVIFSFGSVRRARYVIPFYPLLAAWMAAWLMHACADVRTPRWLRVAPRTMLTTTVFIVLTFGVLALVRHQVRVEPARDMAQAVAKEPVAALGVPLEYIAQIRLVSGGRFKVTDLPKNANPDTVASYPSLLLSESARAMVDDVSYTVTPCAFEYKKLNWHDAIRSKGEKPPRVFYYLYERKDVTRAIP